MNAIRKSDEREINLYYLINFILLVTQCNLHSMLKRLCFLNNGPLLMAALYASNPSDT